MPCPFGFLSSVHGVFTATSLYVLIRLTNAGVLSAFFVASMTGELPALTSDDLKNLGILLLALFAACVAWAKHFGVLQIGNWSQSEDVELDYRKEVAARKAKNEQKVAKGSRRASKPKRSATPQRTKTPKRKAVRA